MIWKSLMLVTGSESPVGSKKKACCLNMQMPFWSCVCIFVCVCMYVLRRY